MFENHQRAIQKLTALFQDDPAFLALIIGGSIAKGLAKEESDVDFMLVATDEEFARRAPLNQLQYFSLDLTDYPGGYVDGKIINLDFLREVADHGSEPARWAFTGTIIVYSRVPELADLLHQITIYPERERAQKMQSFHAQIQGLRWFAAEAEKRGDVYLMAHAAADLVLFSARLILAHNRVLYPFHKWLMTELRRVQDKPENVVELAEALLTQPSRAAAEQFADLVLNFADWEAPPEGWGMRFMTDVEWAWRTGRPAIEDL
ncbi:MAG TPA: nucleotidyltransferase domain-containing protein [Phototrophicaceae bacterium]|nr:nucleotidyltransferase domain-containing protein [Phototrophicaceae bacterium]